MDKWRILELANNVDCRCRNEYTDFQNHILCIHSRNTEKTCDFENCPLKADETPITPEWLESVGAAKDTRFSWVEYRFDTCDGFFELVASFFDGSQNVKLMHYERGNILAHIKTRYQFSELYRLLAGRELGE